MPNSKYKLRYLPLFYIIGCMENIRPVDVQWVYYFDIGLDVIRYYSFIREFEKACNELRICESYK